MVKLLFSGGVHEKTFSLFNQRITALNNSPHGPFDAVIVVGDFHIPDDYVPPSNINITIVLPHNAPLPSNSAQVTFLQGQGDYEILGNNKVQYLYKN